MWEGFFAGSDQSYCASRENGMNEYIDSLRVTFSHLLDISIPRKLGK